MADKTQVGDTDDFTFSITQLQYDSEGVGTYQAVDPADGELTVIVKTPTTTNEYTYPADSEVVRLTTGKYKVSFTYTESGGHNYGYRITGDVRASGSSPGEFYVAPAPF